jgi:tRNA(Ile)-lysidine synthase
MIDRVRRTVRRFNLATATTKVVAALSGGSDSTALTCLLQELHTHGDLQLVGLAHFNHQLRTPAVRDESFCRQLAASAGLPILVEREDVAARARHTRRSIEVAGRAARYEFFERARRHFDADVIALGHTRDDQAETYLLRLVRGAGLKGLASMHPRRGSIIRPLLECHRVDLRQMLDARGMSFMHDETNDDLTVSRNRIRAELLPLLKARFNPSIVDVLADQAELAREEWLWMAAEADALATRVCRRHGTEWRLDIEGLKSAPPALARLVVHRVMTEASGGLTIPFMHVDQVLTMTVASGRGRSKGQSGRIDAPGQLVERMGPHLVLQPRPPGVRGRWAPARGTSFEYPLSIPGEVRVKESGCLVTAEAPAPAGSALTGDWAGPASRTAIVRRDQCRSLTVRSRKPGDRFRPVGVGGVKKLQDFFVDRKVARLERDAVPLVVDDADRIVWVAGYAIDDQFRVTDPAQAVLILRLKVLGGPE